MAKPKEVCRKCGHVGSMRLYLPRVTQKEHEKREVFEAALRESTRLLVQRDQPAKLRKRKRDKAPRQLYEPLVRGTRQKLILPARVFPCDYCANAHYNDKCKFESICLPFNFHYADKASRLADLSWPTPPKGKKRCTARTAKKSPRTSKAKRA
jgi:hypothetical protein